MFDEPEHKHLVSWPRYRVYTQVVREASSSMYLFLICTLASQYTLSSMIDASESLGAILECVCV